MRSRFPVRVLPLSIRRGELSTVIAQPAWNWVEAVERSWRNSLFLALLSFIQKETIYKKTIFAITIAKLILSWHVWYSWLIWASFQMGTCSKNSADTLFSQILVLLKQTLPSKPPLIMTNNVSIRRDCDKLYLHIYIVVRRILVTVAIPWEWALDVWHKTEML